VIRVILISHVRPYPDIAGQVVLYRHLVDEPEIDLQVLETEPTRLGVNKLARWILGRLARTWCRRYVMDIMAMWLGRWIDPELPEPENTDMPTVVMTVAQEDACYAAMRYAQLHDLPLVTFFHDWWPDAVDVHLSFRQRHDEAFRSLYHASALALCVSPGMREKLGEHPNAKVLWPIPSSAKATENTPIDRDDTTFRVVYAGSLGYYGKMLGDALEVLKDHPSIRLEVRGRKPPWSQQFEKEMSDLGLLLPFASRDEFDTWLGSADAFLIPQSFDVHQRGLMQTNFPSKLPEMSRVGKPLIVWGPPDASGPRWTRETGQGLVVEDLDPLALQKALEQLYSDKDEQLRLTAAAKEAALGSFNPERIQADFLRWLREVAI
jgi:glycosyltransferase involved in cell wall biosynthesis